MDVCFIVFYLYDLYRPYQSPVNFHGCFYLPGRPGPAYRTPLGGVPVSPKTETLRKNPLFQNLPDDQEHSLEVQLPFLQSTLPPFQIIPVMVGPGTEETVAQALLPLIDDKTLIIASSDLSPYHDYNTAAGLDKSCTDAICNLDLRRFQGQEACSLHGITVLMYIAKKTELDAQTPGPPQQRGHLR
jgi:AmmeMemoRadiSam system protein B